MHIQIIPLLEFYLWLFLFGCLENIYSKRKETGLSQFNFFSQLTLSLSKIELKKKKTNKQQQQQPRKTHLLSSQDMLIRLSGVEG